jgi:hypothetical protein
MASAVLMLRRGGSALALSMLKSIVPSGWGVDGRRVQGCISSLLCALHL